MSGQTEGRESGTPKGARGSSYVEPRITSFIHLRPLEDLRQKPSIPVVLDWSLLIERTPQSTNVPSQRTESLVVKRVSGHHQRFTPENQSFWTDTERCQHSFTGT